MHRAWQAALLTILIMLPCHAATIRVDVDGGGDYLTIGEGVAAASAGDTVLVAAGTYAGELNRDITIQGTGTLLVSEEGPEVTIVDGEYMGPIFTVGTDATVEGFTVTHGQQDEASAFLCYEGATVQDCLITENSGAAMACNGPDSDDWIVIHQCRFLRNGAGIHSFGPLYVVDCSFEENDDYGIASGDVTPYASSCNVSRCTFSGNGGVGVRSVQEDGVIGRSVFTGNEGGGIEITDGWTDVSFCTVVQNSSTTGPAVYATGNTHGGGPTVTRSIIAFNSCLGGILTGGDSEISYSIIHGNAGGDSLSGAYHDNYFGDPLLCDPFGGNLAPCEDSPALDMSAGAFDEPGCGPCQTPVESASWGVIKSLFR
jgi:hypothetical protein